jgi:hypothetical protein
MQWRACWVDIIKANQNQHLAILKIPDFIKVILFQYKFLVKIRQVSNNPHGNYLHPAVNQKHILWHHRIWARLQPLEC